MEKLKIQVLAAAMNQNDTSLIEKMNLQTDALIGNQCEYCSDEILHKNGHTYIYYNRKDRGVGLNRNTILLHASSDVILFADADMVYVDGYEEIVQCAYRKLPDADAIIFNLKTFGGEADRRVNAKIKRIRFYNAFNYGAARITARRIPLQRENILFHTCFGGGTLFSSGEDSLFIAKMLRKHLKIYTYPVTLAAVDQNQSTWFRGYNDKYYYDKGALFCAINSHVALLLCLQDLIRHPNYISSGLTFWDAFKCMCNGIRNFKTLTPYDSDKSQQDHDSKF